MRFFVGLFLLITIRTVAQTGTGITIKCDADTSQSYSICLPPNYNKTQKYPALFLFDPAARGAMVTGLYQKAASGYGFILVASNNSRNGPMNESLNAANVMFADAFKKYIIDEGQVYLGGFSGGARVATTIALQTSGIAGVIACGAGFGEPIPKGKFNWTFAGIAGTRDFNYVELQQIAQLLRTNGTPTELLIFNGPHTWPPIDVLMTALQWSYLQHQKSGVGNVALQKELQLSLSRYHINISDEELKKELAYQQKIAEAFQLIMQNSPDSKSKSWWKSELSALNKLLFKRVAADSDYVARQKAFITANASESFGNYYSAKRYVTAAELLIVSDVFEPDSPAVLYRHALLAAAERK